MFEKCGIMDVFSALWKHKWLIVVVAALAAAVGLGLGTLESGGGEPLSSEENVLWVASASYLVTDTSEVPETTGETSLSRHQQKAYGILSVATADYKRAQIFESLSAKYTPEQIVEGLNLETTPDQLSFYSFLDVVNGSVPSGTSILHVFLTGKDEQIVTDYMESLNGIVESAAVEIGDCEVKYIDGVVGQKAEESESGLVAEISPLSQGILFGTVGLLLMILAVAAKAIFWPTVNRRSDFAAYDLPVLGEVRIGK